MVNELGKTIKTALASIGLTISAVVLVSSLVAYGSSWPFNEAFGFSMIFGGVAIMYAGAMASAGAAESGAVRSAFMTGGHHAKYYERYSNERQSRRDSQFWYMLVMVIAGVILVAIGIYAF